MKPSRDGCPSPSLPSSLWLSDSALQYLVASRHVDSSIDLRLNERKRRVTYLIELSYVPLLLELTSSYSSRRCSHSPDLAVNLVRIQSLRRANNVRSSVAVGRRRRARHVGQNCRRRVGGCRRGEIKRRLLLREGR